MNMECRPEIILTAPVLDDFMTELRRAYVVHEFWTAEEPASFLRDRGSRVRAMVTTGPVGASRELMEALPHLGLIATYSVGADAIDLDFASSRNVAVTNTPDVLTEDVADMAIGLLLSLCRRIVEGDSYIRNRFWVNKGALRLGRRVYGGRAGILGMGRIGRAVSRRLQAFDIAVSYHDISPVLVPHVYYTDLRQMAKEVDFLILTIAGGPSTEKMVNRSVLAELGCEGVLINVSRGSVVDENDLLDALKSGLIAGAGLDVFLNEPAISERFMDLPNVVLGPHHASGTVETRRAMAELVLANLAAYFTGKPLLTPVTLR